MTGLSCDAVHRARKIMYALDAVACEMLVALPISRGTDRVMALQRRIVVCLFCLLLVESGVMLLHCLFMIGCMRA